MSFPTSNPFRFATNQLNWIIPTAARKLSGYLGGEPIPSGEHDILFGTLTDWVTWLRDSTVAPMEVPVALLRFEAVPDTGTLSYTELRTIPFTGTDPINGVVKWTQGADQFIKFRAAISLKAGKITSADIIVSSLSVDDATLSLFVYSSSGALIGTFTDTSVSAGTNTLAGTAVDVGHDSYGIFEVMVGETTGNTIAISRLGINWGSP
jgi:hypothetical protein